MRVSEIAQRAGVSMTTVSRVLNDDPNVRPETALQVQKVLAQHPYDRNAVRRGPRPGKRRKVRSVGKLRHNTIAIVVLGHTHEQWFKQPIFASIVSSITRMAADRHINVRIEELLDIGDLSDRISSNTLDGALLFISSFAKPELLETIRTRLPVVRVVGDEMIPTSIDHVRSDNLAIGHLAYNYLARNGCKRLACVTSRLDHGGIYLRTFAFASASVREGHVRPTIYVIGPAREGVWVGADVIECDSFEAVAKRLAADGDGPTGLFISQDIEAIGLYPHLAHYGVRPGHDVQIVSCNNDQSLALLSPRPATIDLDAPSIGKWALRRLLNRIIHPEEAFIQMLVKPVLVPPQHVSADLM